jgi:hypothetical protein
MICPKCGSTERFKVSARRPSGLCRNCVKATDRAWNTNNPGKVNTKNRKWKSNNPEKVREMNRTWKEKNPEKWKAIIETQSLRSRLKRLSKDPLAADDPRSKEEE